MKPDNRFFRDKLIVLIRSTFSSNYCLLFYQAFIPNIVFFIGRIPKFLISEISSRIGIWRSLNSQNFHDFWPCETFFLLYLSAFPDHFPPQILKHESNHKSMDLAKSSGTRFGVMAYSSHEFHILRPLGVLLNFLFVAEKILEALRQMFRQNFKKILHFS